MLLSVTYVCFSKRFVTFQVVNIFRLPKLPNITWATVAELIIIKQNTNASFIQPSLSRSPSLVHFQPLSSCDFFCWQNYYHWAPVGFEQKSTTLKENVFGAVTHYMQFQTHSNSNNIDSYYSQKYSHYICLNFEKESANTTIVEHKKKYFVNCHYYYYYKNVFCLSYSYLSYLSYLSSSFSSFFFYVVAYLVEIFATTPWAAAARNFDVFDGEFVVVGELFAALDPAQGEDDDVFLEVNIHDAGIAIRLSVKKERKKERDIITKRYWKFKFQFQKRIKYKNDCQDFRLK